MNREPLFHLVDGSPVFRDDVLHVAPRYLHRAGATCKAEFAAQGDEVTVRSIPEGAVPTVPIAALSREPHPDTTDRAALAEMLRTSTRNISERDLEMFRAGQLHAHQQALARMRDASKARELYGDPDLGTAEDQLARHRANVEANLPFYDALAKGLRKNG